MKKKSLITLAIVLGFVAINYFLFKDEIKLYLYLKSDSFIEDVYYIERRTDQFQMIFQKMPADNENFIDFIVKNNSSENDVLHLQRIIDNMIQLSELDATKIIISQVKHSNDTNFISVNDINFLSVLLKKQNIIIGNVEKREYSCEYTNNYVLALNNNNIEFEIIKKLRRKLNELSRNISLETRFSKKHYICIRANLVNNNWKVEVLCDKDNILTTQPLILERYQEFLNSFDINNIDYVLIGMFLHPPIN